MTELEKHERRLIEWMELLIRPLQLSSDQLREEWKEHKEEVVKSQSLKLTHQLKTEKKKNKALGKRVRWLEDKILENNVIIHGISEAAWESEEVCKEKVFCVLANLVN